MIYCKRCVYPEIAVNLHIDEEGVCSSCRVFEKFAAITPEFWEMRKKKFEHIAEEMKKRSQGKNYDCIVAVSGGKDSYFQTHIINQFGLKPLLVTYNGGNFLPEGDYNRDNMRKVFDADHLVMGPSTEVLKKLNRLGFEKMGDMNWHNHCGIQTYPVQVAVKMDIPIVIWGETFWDISGMFEPDDYVEYSARVRHEHSNRGFEWYDFVNDDPKNKLTEQDMLWAKYPTDEEILKVGVRGLYIGNYFPWDPNAHAKLVEKKYGWKPASKPFERTYRNISNLDDRYENGMHDYLKYVKFGYGRASDHASKDIRTGYMDRNMAIKMVKKYDDVISSDLYYWLKYVGMTESHFWKVANSFRDPRVWHKDSKGKWVKDNIWDEKPKSKKKK